MNTKFEIKHRFSGAILFSLETESLRLCVEAAVKSATNLRDANLRDADLGDANLRGADLGGAYLGGANLRDANLRDADLGDANLRGADLGGANLRGANLGDANLRGANLGDANLRGADLGDANLRDADLRGAKFDTASPEEIARLDEVREIVLAKPERLKMEIWHSEGWTAKHTPQEEHTCGSAHCIAGWLQALSPDPKIRAMEPAQAGFMLAPTAAPKFYVDDATALEWLKERGYAKTAAPEQP